MVDKQFVIVKQNDNKFCIHYQTRISNPSNDYLVTITGYPRRPYKSEFVTIRVVDKDIITLDSAKLRKQYFDSWLKTHTYFKLVDKFDPLNETFDDIISRYHLICIDEQLDNFIFIMMNDIFGKDGGWSLDKYYMLLSQNMLDMYFDGYAIGRKYYGNNFRKEDYYTKARDAIIKIASTYTHHRNI